MSLLSYSVTRYLVIIQLEDWPFNEHPHFYGMEDFWARVSED
jgi:hypothetical protein